MRICGIDYAGSDLIPVVIERANGEWRLLQTQPRKLHLKDIYNTGDVRLFAKEMETFLRDTMVDLVVIKTRAKKGPYGGGAASFRMGAVVQLSTEKPVVFISAQAISTATRDLEHPDSGHLLAYQRDAFNTAVAQALRS